ncbi:PIG-L deacetylase family protein [Erythrobacter sp. GH1-10]|uniref:PIG-L deacetylase family protein n=1 Tax=Erythrobacter sp. GH1-10 TaxID=3349334 RepID=UPI003877E1F4
MPLIENFGRTLVIAPHPDDEVLGCGGTIARLVAQGDEVQVLVATEGKPPQFPQDGVERVREEMRIAHATLGVTQTHQLDLPAAALDTVPASKVNAAIAERIDSIRPETLLLPFFGDIHSDHQIVFTAAMVAARPRSAQAPRQILCYETLSETNWYAPPMTPAFTPNVFVDISDTLSKKIEAFKKFESQVRPFPEERSVEAIEALARLRGSTVFLKAAEAFATVRQIVR